jgi:hypothetical protein
MQELKAREVTITILNGGGNCCFHLKSKEVRRARQIIVAKFFN